MRVLNLHDTALKYGRTFAESIIDVVGLERVEPTLLSGEEGALVPAGSWGIHIENADNSYDTCNFGVATEAGTRSLLVSIDRRTPMLVNMTSFPYRWAGGPIFAVCP